MIDEQGAYSRRSWLSRISLGLGALGLPAIEAQAQDRIPVAPVLTENSAFRRVTLEVSLKPFKDTSESGIRRTAEEIFRSWAPLLHRCDASAVMLWAADGSEILDYTGRMDDEFNWAKYLGDANPPSPPPKNDPNREGTHGRHWLYMENPPRMTYGTLRTITRILRETGVRMTGKPVEIGATFDPGGEFAVSDFKFHRHPEIARGTARGPNTWVECTAKLHADHRAYAGYPNGIPEGTSIGTFLGRQSQHFLKDLGYEYIWFSNGFGFSLSPWGVTGPLFQGKEFDASKAPSLRDDLLGFWRSFRRECPTYRIETRGSNLMVGADLATSASPVRDLYRGGFNMVAPPNSPWAAIDGDFGLEVVGYLSRISELPPGNIYPFRFYTHDPWWLNSPWLDRYGRDPHDIYLPLAIARVNGDATVTKPAYLEFLTIDNSWGQMPEKVPNEVTPDILSAMEDFSDAPGLVTWVYPFDEYYDMTFGAKPALPQVFFGDWFMRGAVNNGFPLNSVVSTKQFKQAFRVKPDFFRRTTLLAYAPTVNGDIENSLIQALRKGQNVLLYGPVGPDWAPELSRTLGLEKAEPISGELNLQLNLAGDSLKEGRFSSKVMHRPELSGGGVDTIIRTSETAPGQVKVCATVRAGDAERVYALSRATSFGPGTGTLAWVRGTFSCHLTGANLPHPDDPKEWFTAESMMRLIMSELGCSIRFAKPTVETRSPLVFAAQHSNGWFLSSYSPSTVSEVKMRFSRGAPLLMGLETWLEDGHSTYTLPRAAHKEVRCLVEQAGSGEVSCVEGITEYPFFQRRILVHGLKNATVHFYPENERPVVMRVNETRSFVTESLPYNREEDGRRLVIHNVTGTLNIAW